jgi:hypothetical protein
MRRSGPFRYWYQLAALFLRSPVLRVAGLVAPSLTAGLRTPRRGAHNAIVS